MIFLALVVVLLLLVAGSCTGCYGSCVRGMVSFARAVTLRARAVVGYAGLLMVEYHKSSPGTPDPVAGYRLRGASRQRHGLYESSLCMPEPVAAHHLRGVCAREQAVGDWVSGVPVGNRPSHFTRGGAGRPADLCAFGTMRPVALPLCAHQARRTRNATREKAQLK